MDAYGICVGTAIVATYAVEEDETIVRVSGSDLDICDAAVVCNVHIDSDHTTDRYCFQEWYAFGLDTLREVLDPSLFNAKAPKTLEDFQRFPSGFWHKQYLKNITRESEN